MLFPAAALPTAPIRPCHDAAGEGCGGLDLLLEGPSHDGLGQRIDDLRVCQRVPDEGEINIPYRRQFEAAGDDFQVLRQR